MAKINTTNYQPVTAWNGTQDLLIVEQPDGTKVATPEQVKQYMNAFMDDEPTEGSEEAVKSGGVFNAIENSVSLKTATGNPITLTDAANANAEELSMTINPIQSGSGDPSPTNVRPISGISEAIVTRTGKNLIDESALINAVLDPTTGQPSPSTEVKITPMISIKSSVKYLFAHQNNEPFRIFAYAADGTFIERTNIYYDDAVVTTGATWAYVRIQGAASAWIYADPVLAQTVDITIQLGQTVYGGSVNFKTGQVTVTHANISSYNGESINEPWLSSIDKYISGATPTTGAQVVYPLTTPTTLTLTPAELELLKGNNTITANGAEISIEYYPDNAIGALAERVDDAQEQIATKANTADVTAALSNVQTQITGLDTRVTALEGSGVFKMLTNNRINAPQTEESKTMTVTREGAGIFNAANDDIKYLWFVFIADGSNIGIDLPGPICIPRAFFVDQETNFTFRSMRCDVEIRRGDSDNQIIWNWTFDNAEALPSEAYHYRIYVAK